MIKSVAILGLGSYGRSLAKNLYEMGADVLVADRNEELIRDFAPKVTAAICADLSVEEEVKQLGLQNMDVVITAMGQDMAPSIMCTAIAKEAGVPLVVSKASSNLMASLLKRIGADKVINPEEESGLRSARILMSASFFDYFQVDDAISMAEISPQEGWTGKTLRQLDLRRKHNINVVALKKPDGSWKPIRPEDVIHPEERLLVIAEREELEEIYRSLPWDVKNKR